MQHTAETRIPKNPLLALALAYARLGWRVFPQHTIYEGRCTCGDPDCGGNAGKHADGKLAPNGRHSATTDPGMIEAWWNTHPDANIGIVTGPESGLVVLDVDGDQGTASLQALEAEHGPLPETVMAHSGGGGRHYYFRHPGVPIVSRSGALGSGLDVKADGGSITAPPSRHLSGNQYRWVEGHTPNKRELAPLPEWLLALMTAEGKRQASTNHGPRASSASTNGQGARIVAGQRNEHLTSLAGTMRMRGMTEAEILTALQKVNHDRCDPPLAEAEVARIAKSVSRYAPSDPALAVDLPLSDIGNAQRLVARHGHDLRYVPQWGKWLVWDGTRWRVDETGEVERRAKDTVLALYEAARQLPAYDEASMKRRATRIKYAERCQSESRLRAMLSVAQSERQIVADVSTLDANPWLLNVRNGTLDLRTGELRPHRREDRITKCAPVEFDPQARAPRWLSFLDRVLGGDLTLIEYVQMAVGYSLTGVTREQCWFVLYGSGRNGKSVFVNVPRALLGDGEYARHTPSETLLATRNSERVRNDLARLQGARLVTAAEVEDGHRVAEALVKQLTGQDPVTARFLYREYFEFMPTFKLWLAVNFRPRMRWDDPASWRRVRLIPFTVKIPEHEQDKQLFEKLLTELPGILNWAIEGAIAWQQSEGGLKPPAVVAEATEQYREEMDSVGRFIKEECVIGPDCRVTRKALYDAYRAWCANNGVYAEPAARVVAALERRGIRSIKVMGQRSWQGIGLQDSESNLAEAA